jgi:hypothetical protein
MADWTENTLVITGPQELVKTLRDSIAGTNAAGNHSELALSRIVPPPDTVTMNDWKTWTAWAVEHWGSDREPDPVEVKEETVDDREYRLTYVFKTAYFSGEKVVRALIEQHPGLDFDLRFVGEQLWSGQVKGSGGRVVESVEHDEPESHAESVEQTGRCNCDGMWPILPGCGDDAIDEARKGGGLSDSAEKLARLLVTDWDDDFSALFEFVNESEARALSAGSTDALLKLIKDWDGPYEELLDVLEAL